MKDYFFEISSKSYIGELYRQCKHRALDTELLRVFLTPSSPERCFIIPSFCECVWSIFEEQRENQIGTNEASVAEYTDLLADSFEKACKWCRCRPKERPENSAFLLDRKRESTYSDWSPDETILRKKQCEACGGNGETRKITKSPCQKCNQKGFSVRKDSKEIRLCDECKGFGKTDSIKILNCEGCQGLGFHPKVLIYNYIDIECETCSSLGYLSINSLRHKTKIEEENDDKEIDEFGYFPSTLPSGCKLIFDELINYRDWQNISFVEKYQLTCDDDLMQDPETDTFIEKSLRPHELFELHHQLNEECDILSDIITELKLLPYGGRKNIDSVEIEARSPGLEKCGEDSTIGLRVMVKSDILSSSEENLTKIPCPTCQINYDGFPSPKAGNIRLTRLIEIVGT